MEEGRAGDRMGKRRGREQIGRGGKEGRKFTIMIIDHKS
jgi:hypothetical protein